MEVEINLWAVLLATLASMVVGSVWYAPPVFGNWWMKAVDLTKEKAEKAGWKPIVISILTSLITAYVLAHVTYLSASFYTDVSFFAAALTSAFWVWLGFTAARIVTHDVFEGRPTKLTALNLAHELVTLLAMGVVIGLMG